MAQPQKSRVQSNRNATAKKAETATVGRAALMFPTAVDVPENPAWRRDIYRSVDLTKDENAALYYPVEPQGGDMNLFTLLFKLLNTGKIPAYEYQLDGTMFTVIRYSGVRQKPKVVKFMELDLKELILISEDGTSRTEEIEAITAKAQPKRITYYLNAQDPNRPSLVLYARGYGDEAGRYVKAYINPSAEMINNMKLVAPGKVFSYEI
jgi:hypothetical protein